MVKAMGNPLVDHLHHQRMQSQRLCHKIPHARKGLSRFSGQARNILTPMSPRRQKIGKHNHQLRPPINTTPKRRRNRGLGQFHMRRLNNFPSRMLAKRLDHLKKLRVARFELRPVVNENDGDLLERNAELIEIKCHAQCQRFFSVGLASRLTQPRKMSAGTADLLCEVSVVTLYLAAYRLRFFQYLSKA